ncbi:MAG: arabinogalactan endo-1,4-beta-galactosidase [Bacteroidetes bacterium]|nr:MAG: arabinogalactan endo-1,4-beta-galactosidase [Bacteroidota bacterium]TAG89628.1 MAG: arabinogalactan endo-1,4-beta-galactosidase [Bacteroidota bacterium]
MKKIIVYCCFIILIACKSPDSLVIDEIINTEKILSIKGADMSYLPEIRQSGITFYNQNNQPEDMLLTLKKAGVNVIRLRIWKNPAEPNSNFLSVKNLSNEIKNLGMEVMITVHYSDTWADPSQQTKPNQWQNIPFNQLKDSVYNYTKKIVTEINPKYIQIGNEINNGLLWNEGNIANLSQMKQLLEQGIRGVRNINNTTKIIIHFAGFDNASFFYQNITDLDYDIIGLSYYPMWHGKDLEQLKQSLNNLSSFYNKPIFIAETSYPFTFDWNDWTNNVVGMNSQILPAYPATPQGQKDYLNKIKAIIKDVPKGIGFCYWGSEFVSYKGNTATNGSSYENQAFWDFNNKSLPVLECYR